MNKMKKIAMTTFLVWILISVSTSYSNRISYVYQSNLIGEHSEEIIRDGITKSEILCITKTNPSTLSIAISCVKLNQGNEK